MRARVVLFSALAASIAVLVFSATASAANYCLYAGPECDHSYDATQTGLMQAVEDAHDADTVDDTILIGPNKIDIDAAVNVFAGATNKLQISGAGEGVSTLHFTSGTGWGLVFNFGGADLGGLDNLSVVVDGATSGQRSGVVLDGGRATSVDFDVHNGSNGLAVGATLQNGATCSFCDFAMYNDDTFGAVATGPATVARSVFADADPNYADSTGLLVQTTTGPVTVRQSRFTALQHAVSVEDGTASIRDSVIDMADNEGAQGVVVEKPGNNATGSLSASLDGVTVVGAGSFQRGLGVFAETTAATGLTASAGVTNSLFLLDGSSPSEMRCLDADNGSGSVAITYSFVSNDSPSSSGCSTSVLQNVDNNAAVPGDLFVNWDEGDFRLIPGAPVIDKGDPATVKTGRGFDAITGARFVDPLDANAANPTIDMGAIEYQDYPPDTPKLSVSATTVTVGEPIEFTATSIDGNNDAPITFGWDFKDGSVPSDSGTQTHAFAAPGQYAVNVVAHAGGLGSTAASVLITVKARTDCCSAGAGYTNLFVYNKPSGPFKFKKGAKLKNGFAVNAKKPKGPSIKMVVTGKTAEATFSLSSKKGKALKGAQTLKLREGTSYITFGGKWNKKLLPSGSYNVTIKTNGMPNRLSMNMTVAKQGSSGRTK